jgi:GNAT superfamily N-acetyltransferase
MTRGSGASIRVMEAAQADPSGLSAFLEQAFGPLKGRFLFEHGDWLHRGTGRRFVATCDGAIAGYRAMLPSACLLEGREIPAVWAHDLYVLPRFRGRGLQRLLDERLLESARFEGASLLLSFPTEIGSKIYAEQGYGIRKDIRWFSASLHPRLLGERAPGTRGALRRAGSSGLAAALRARSSRYRPKRTEVVASPDPNTLEDLFRRCVASDTATTLRSSEFLRWRYLEAPYRSELQFYLTGPQDRPTHYAIVRYVGPEDSVRVRILDVFGDFSDADGLIDLFRTVVRDATLRGALSVIFRACSPELARAARSAGLLFSGKSWFRWLADMPPIHERFYTINLHWVYGDGAHDPPE